MAHRNRWFSQRTKPPFIFGIFAMLVLTRWYPTPWGYRGTSNTLPGSNHRIIGSESALESSNFSCRNMGTAFTKTQSTIHITVSSVAGPKKKFWQVWLVGHKWQSHWWHLMKITDGTLTIQFMEVINQQIERHQLVINTKISQPLLKCVWHFEYHHARIYAKIE